MKCLFFLYGEYRTFPTAVKTWNILDTPNLDIVIHTPPNTSEHISSKTIQPISKEKFDVLGNPNVFFYDRYSYQKTDLHVLHHSYRFLSKYLNSNSDKIYDYVFIGRLDSSFYLEKYTDLFNIKEDILFCLNTPRLENNNEFVPDHTFFGSYKTIKKFVDNLPSTEYLENSHQDIAKYIGNNFKYMEWHYPFESYHIRPKMEKYFENYFNKFGKIKEVDNNYVRFISDFLSNKYKELETEYKKINE